MKEESAFERYVTALLMAFYGYDVEPVADENQGVWGCDLIIKSKGIVIRVFGPEEMGYFGDAHSDKVKSIIEEELSKIRQNRIKIENMLGRSIYAWELVISADPSPEVQAAAGEAGQKESFQVRILGKSFLKNIRDSVGFDPSETSWVDLRKTMLELKKESLYGECRLDQIFVEPSVQVILPLLEKKKSEKFERRFFQCLLDFIVGPEETEFRGCRKRPAVLFGNRGGGKTGALKMMASLLAEDERGPMPVYVPLHRAFAVSSESLDAAVKQYVRIHHDVVLSDADLINRPICWFFDDFDKLCLAKGENLDWIRKRYQEVINFARPEKSTVILASRSIPFFSRSESMDMQTARITLKPLDETRIQRWAQRWTSFPSKDRTGLSLEGLRRRSLIQDCGSPLILFMTAMLFDRELSEERPYLKAEIFKYFIDAVQKGTTPGSPEEKDEAAASAREILQEIASEVFRFSETGIIGEDKVKQHLVSRFEGKNISQDRISAVLSGPFLQGFADGKSGKFYEFSHVLFREYLVAEKAVRLMIEEGKGDFRILEWSGFFEKMPTEKKLEFIGEILCLVGREDRVGVLARMIRRIADPAGLEKELAELPESEAKKRALQSSGFATVAGKLAAYYVSSVIMTNGSPELQEEAGHKLSARASLAAVFHAVLRYPPGSSIVRDWHTFFRFLPGGVMGPFDAWEGFIFKTPKLRRWAVLQPGLKTVSVTSSGLESNLFFLNPSQVLDLDADVINGCFFSGGTVFFRKKEMSIKNCFFINCRLIYPFEPEETNENFGLVLENTLFHRTSFLGDESLRRFFEPKKSGYKTAGEGRLITGETAERILKAAAAVLKERLQSNRYLALIPWGKTIAGHLPEFERGVFAGLHVFPEDDLYRKVSFKSEKRPAFSPRAAKKVSEKKPPDASEEEKNEEENDRSGKEIPEPKEET